MNPDTIITRFYGLHKVKPKKEHSNYIVVMANVLNSSYFDMDEIYDLKVCLPKSLACTNPFRALQWVALLLVMIRRRI